MLYKAIDGDLIKDVYKTGLRTEIADVANELIKQIEYPVVFWLDSPLDRNYAANHSININQFWITVKKGTSLQERERIILKNLYMGVQRRKRYLYAIPKIVYSNKKRNDCLCSLAEKINVISSNLECDFFLEKYGITTDETETQFYYNDRIKKLTEYINMQKRMPEFVEFVWYDEMFFFNAIEYAFYSRKNDEYKNELFGLVKKTTPRDRAYNMVKLINKIVLLMDNAYSRFSDENAEKIVNNMRVELVKLLNLNDYIEIVPVDSYQEIKTLNSKQIRILTFVPEDCENEALMIKSFRYINECLGFVRECADNDNYFSLPCSKVAISYDGESNMSSFARLNDENIVEYYILIYSSFASRLWNKIITMDCSESSVKAIEKNMSKAYVIEKLFKYALFYITLHEYAHILNGDCDNSDINESEQERLEKEQKADEYADLTVSKILNYQYRAVEYLEMRQCEFEDMVLIKQAIEIAKSLRM